MRTSNAELLAEIDTLEDVKRVDANELEVVKHIEKLERDKADLINMLGKVYGAVRSNYKQGGDCDYWIEFNELLERSK